MSEHRSLEQRTADVQEALSRNGDVYLSSASPSGQPHLIAASSWWDGDRIVVATTAASRTARNLDATLLARLALGTPADMIVIDVSVADAIGVDQADRQVRDGFAAAVGWNPADEGPGWRFFRLSPARIQAYRGYGRGNQLGCAALPRWSRSIQCRVRRAARSRRHARRTLVG